MRKMIEIDDELLIESVRSYPQLYDVTHPQYVDTDGRTQIWRQIGEKLDTDATCCKRRWNNIRDNYRKSLRRIGPGQRYRFASKLEFLNDHFHDKDQLVATGYTITKTEFDDQTSDYSDDFDNNTNNEVTADIIFEDVNNDDDASNQSNDYSSTIVDDSKTKSLRKSRKKKRLETSRIVNSKSKRRTIGESSGEIHSTSVTTQADAVDAFLAGLAPTLKVLTPYYLNLAKTKIFSIVQEYELAMILEQQKSSTPITMDKS